ncbi:hypothetical protein Tco_1320430 [Tanacetum coccineum]
MSDSDGRRVVTYLGGFQPFCGFFRYRSTSADEFEYIELAWDARGPLHWRPLFKAPPLQFSCTGPKVAKSSTTFASGPRGDVYDEDPEVDSGWTIHANGGDDGDDGMNNREEEFEDDDVTWRLSGGMRRRRSSDPADSVRQNRSTCNIQVFRWRQRLVCPERFGERSWNASDIARGCDFRDAEGRLERSAEIRELREVIRRDAQQEWLDDSHTSGNGRSGGKCQNNAKQSEERSNYLPYRWQEALGREQGVAAARGGEGGRSVWQRTWVGIEGGGGRVGGLLGAIGVGEWGGCRGTGLAPSTGISVESAKIESIKDWASPKSPTEIRQFLGLVGYYRRFIKWFSKIAKPMTKLTQKKVKFEWDDKQEAAFQLLKQKLCSAPILALPEGMEDFIAYLRCFIRRFFGVCVFNAKRKGECLCITPTEDS